MVVAKPLGKNPREIATQLADAFKADPEVTSRPKSPAPASSISVSPMPPGTPCCAPRSSSGADFGRADIGKGEKVNVEYVSANPTGPMHVGHTRGAVFGDALASLMAYAGYDVTREYYINDAGGQIEVLAQSAFLRYREALGEVIEIPRGLYPGDYLIPVGQELAAEYAGTLRYKPEKEWLPIVKDFDPRRDDGAHPRRSPRSSASGTTCSSPSARCTGRATATSTSPSTGCATGARLPGPARAAQGPADEDWEDREQTLFRAKEFGDDIDRALLKSDGSYTYFAADIAYHRNKCCAASRT